MMGWGPRVNKRGGASVKGVELSEKGRGLEGKSWGGACGRGRGLRGRGVA